MVQIVENIRGIHKKNCLCGSLIINTYVSSVFTLAHYIVWCGAETCCIHTVQSCMQNHTVAEAQNKKRFIHDSCALHQG